MNPPPAPPTNGLQRIDSNSQASETSQTAQDYISSQLSLEADAREALPYQFDTCTKHLGPLRQSVYACLTCTPPPASPHQQFTPAGICYSCSISCHGEHELVELFTKRDFECDCGTTRLSNSGTPCTLRLNTETGRKGGVVGEKAREGNKYNHNFQGQFCACGDEYDPEKEKGTMFQCLGLGTVEDGGCGEDWWHPECLMGLERLPVAAQAELKTNGVLESVKEETENENGETTADGAAHEEATDVPAGFPDEDDFDHLICYKCVNSFPWIKKYAGSHGFQLADKSEATTGKAVDSAPEPPNPEDSKKRKAEDDLEESQDSKKAKSGMSGDDEAAAKKTNGTHTLPKHAHLPPAPTGDYLTLFLKEDFRDHFCRCPDCFPALGKHKQLLEEEEAYEPPLSESGDSDANAPSINSGSLYQRGEAALSSIDRVRAIEGVMAYNHVKDKVKAFLAPFAESGQPVGAEDIKAYFAKLRGDEQGALAAETTSGDGNVEKDFRKEQGGY